MIERLNPGPRMSGAVKHGNTVYLSGLVPEAPAEMDFAQQTASVLARIDAQLAEAGTDKSKILTATIWLTDMADFAAMNEIWDAWVAAGNAPARATVQAALAHPAIRIEIQVVAALD